MRTKTAKPVLCCAAMVLLVSGGPARAADDHATSYLQHNLVSDLPGLADRTDPNLVNAWGIVHSATSPWWVNANGTGLSLVYDGAGAAFPAANPIKVAIPAASAGGTSAPTGIVFNGTTDFQLTTGNPARFLFVTEDGTISGWNPAVSPTTAVIKVTTPMAVYKGVALGQMGTRNVLYAANFHAGAVEAYDAGFNPLSLPSGAFQDFGVPAGFAPFNVQNIGGNIFVMYAKQDESGEDDVAGPGEGYVDEFTPAGALVRRFQHGPWLNSPWGVAVAPDGFGKLSGRVLVGNFGSGQIASYSLSGEFQGLMRGRHGKPITIDGLWGLGFGNGGTAGPATTLFFAAGIQDEAHGLFGTLVPVANGNHGEDESGDR